MKTESLTANRESLTGRMPARELGSSDELPFLGRGSEAGRKALKEFEAAGMVDESSAERGEKIYE